MALSGIDRAVASAGSCTMVNPSRSLIILGLFADIRLSEIATRKQISSFAPGQKRTMLLKWTLSYPPPPLEAQAIYQSIRDDCFAGTVHSMNLTCVNA
jgi:hypothetical protein